jgi:hypothetical protein
VKPLVVFAAAVALYLPTLWYGFVQDDRAIIAANPAAQSIGRALRAFDQPYWPPESGAGLYRPATILSYAVDWSLSGGRPGWLHLMNALWHGLAAVLLMLIVARWLPPLGAAAAGLIFAWHPVHVEAVASLVGRAELLAAVGILGAVLAARRGWWVGAVVCAALAMLSKEHGVIAGVAILLDNWLYGSGRRAYPVGLWIALAAVTAGFVAAWLAIGRAGASDVAAVFIGRGAMARLAVALPAAARAAELLIWPAALSADYGPQVIPARTSFSLAAGCGAAAVIAVPLLVVWCRRRAPAIAFTAALAACSYLPTSNLLFPSGVVLAERNLYLAVGVAAALAGTGLGWVASRWGTRPAVAALGIVALPLGLGSLARLPAWRDNRSQLLTLLTEHPESYRAHASAAAVLAGLRDTLGARQEYRVADSLFAGDPHLDAARALYLLGLGDTTEAAPLVRRARASTPHDRIALRAQFLLWMARGRAAGGAGGGRAAAAAVADSAQRRYPWERGWYTSYLQ